MINTVNPTLDIAPERFNSVDVGNPTDILLGRVLDYLVGISERFNVVIARKFIGKDNCLILFSNLSFNHGQEGMCFDIGNYLSDRITATLYHAHDNRFTRCATSTFAGVLAADVCFIDFNLTDKRVNVFGHEFTNLVEYTPCGFVGDTQFPLELLGRNSGFGGGHQEDSVEPRTKRGIRLVEDSTSRRREVRPAELTGIDLTVGYPVMSGDFLALLAVNTIRIATLEYTLKASIISRILLVKVFECVFRCFHFSLQSQVSNRSIAQILRDVKGYLPSPLTRPPPRLSDSTPTARC